MTSEWDRQRDIEAEGQRAAVYHAKKGEGESLPQRHGAGRIVGINADGQRVDNVTEHNRTAVDPNHPWLHIHLLSEDKLRIMHGVYIPNTRERPDAVVYDGRVYEVVTTRIPIPQYRLILTLNAVLEPPTGDTENV